MKEFSSKLDSILDRYQEIEKNSLIGASSFVNKSIPKNCVAYGQPARVVELKAISENE